jgi:TatD DNase family protein
MFWFDSHAHLQDEAFASDWQAVLERASRARIGRILLPASDLDDSKRAMERAGQDPRLVCAVGCHPHAAGQFSNHDLEEYRRLADLHRGQPVVAIGEIGLDYHYDFAPRPVQQAVFKALIDLAWECRLPMIIHEREAAADCLAILIEKADAGRLLPCPGVFHCYSGSPETAVTLLKMGFYIGVDGPVTFANARKLPEVIRQCPPDRLVLETDSPYLTPVPHRGEKNEPSFLPLIGSRVAEIWQIPETEVARLTTGNACRLFNLPDLN